MFEILTEDAASEFEKAQIRNRVRSPEIVSVLTVDPLNFMAKLVSAAK